MKIYIFVISLLLTFSSAWTTTIFFPEFHLHSELDQNLDLKSSYLIDMNIDTGRKYGLIATIGLKGYQVSSIESNAMTLNSIRLITHPFQLFELGYFFGKNKTLGYNEIGYQGFQFHRRENFEYYGYKTIKGTGMEISKAFWDNLLVPSLLVYRDAVSSVIHFDTLLYLTLDNYQFETYFGLDSNLNNTFGVTLKTIYGSLDFMLSLYKPDGSFANFPSFDDFYINLTEHVIFGYFEQTISLFSRPSSFNGLTETIKSDIDVYAMLGLVIDRFGLGTENTVLFSDSYTLTDRVGAYLYYQLNSLKYKVGGYYNLFGNAYTSSWGVFVNINGKL